MSFRIARERGALAACLAPFASTGCVTRTLADAGIGAAYEGSLSIDTIQDYEIGRAVIQANIGQIEGFHSLSPGNVTGLLMLTKGWTAIGMGSKTTTRTLYVGVELVRRSVALDPALDYAMGETILGAYHARSALAELGESKMHFDKALSSNHGKFLTTKIFLAQRYYCLRGDRASYERTLNEVLSEPDSLPEARLQNAVAKRLAYRYLGNKIWQEECGF